MTSESSQYAEGQGDALGDSGLRCPRCEYNLTGLTGDRCPECGTTIDWDTVRYARDVESKRPSTCWARWPWHLKPLGFFVTAIQAALLPWAFARQLPSRPRWIAPLVFLAVCILIGLLTAKQFSGAGGRDLCMWVVGVASHVVLQTLVFGLILPLPGIKRPFRFWLTVTCYTSYPLLLEGFSAPPFILPFHRESSIWPFAVFCGDTPAWLTTILFYVWWAGLSVIAFVRLPQRHRRRAVILVLAVFVMTVVSSYSGCEVGSYVAGQLL